jgi:hypothetical protein
MAVFEAYDASSVVGGSPPAGRRGEVIEEAKKNCGYLIRGIDWVVNKVTGWSLLEAILEPLAGDFNALDSMSQAWQEVAVALGAVGDNYRSLGQQLPGVWTGSASDAAVGRLTSIAGSHDDQQEAAEMIAEQLQALIEVSEATVDTVAACINLVNDIAQDLLASAASGGVGLLKVAFTAPGKVKRMVTLIHRAIEALDKLTSAAKAVARVMKYVNASLNVADGVLDFGNAAANSRAGSMTDETADAGFG